MSSESSPVNESMPCKASPHLARDPARPVRTSLHLRQVRGHRHQAEYRDPRDPSDHECVGTWLDSTQV